MNKKVKKSDFCHLYFRSSLPTSDLSLIDKRVINLGPKEWHIITSSLFAGADFNVKVEIKKDLGDTFFRLQFLRGSLPIFKIEWSLLGEPGDYLGSKIRYI